MARSRKVVANNKKARHDYFVEETYEAGIALTGTEIKSVRAGRVSIKESYAHIYNGEITILGMHISPYEQGNRFNVEPLRERKLLMHKREIFKLAGQIKTDGLTLIPLNVYINEEGYCKVEIGLCRGKKNYDKRESIAKKEANRKMDRAIKDSLRK
ncbi:SsrA-binding protein SmpB [Mogibacterium diversum]